MFSQVLSFKQCRKLINLDAKGTVKANFLKERHLKGNKKCLKAYKKGQSNSELREPCKLKMMELLVVLLNPKQVINNYRSHSFSKAGR